MILAEGFRWGLGDVEAGEEVAGYVHGAAAVAPPAFVIHPGGLDNRYVTQADESVTMCRFRAAWTLNLYLGKPYSKAAYDTLDLWVGRLERSADRCAAHDWNTSGEVPTIGDVTAPFDLPIGESKVSVMVAAVEITINYEPTNPGE